MRDRRFYFLLLIAGLCLAFGILYKWPVGLVLMAVLCAWHRLASL